MFIDIMIHCKEARFAKIFIKKAIKFVCVHYGEFIAFMEEQAV